MTSTSRVIDGTALTQQLDDAGKDGDVEQFDAVAAELDRRIADGVDDPMMDDTPATEDDPAERTDAALAGGEVAADQPEGGDGGGLDALCAAKCHADRLRPPSPGVGC